MSDYINIYRKRLNRYGKDYASRIEGKRAREFEDFLLKTPNRVDFIYNNVLIAAVLEQYQQDHSETKGYLLTPREVEIPNGTIISFKNKKGEENYWLIWWQEQIKTSGYNRYVVLKMNYYFTFNNKGQWGHLSGKGTSVFSDSVLEGLAKVQYGENNNLSLIITPYSRDFERDLYLETKNGERISAFKIEEFDNQTTNGISYLSVTSVAEKDKSPLPEKTSEDKEEEFFWLGGEFK